MSTNGLNMYMCQAHATHYRTQPTQARVVRSLHVHCLVCSSCAPKAAFRWLHPLSAHPTPSTHAHYPYQRPHMQCTIVVSVCCSLAADAWAPGGMSPPAGTSQGTQAGSMPVSWNVHVLLKLTSALGGNKIRPAPALRPPKPAPARPYGRQPPPRCARYAVHHWAWWAA